MVPHPFEETVHGIRRGQVLNVDGVPLGAGMSLYG